VDPHDRRPMEIFTRPISQFCNLLATPEGVDRIGCAAEGLGAAAATPRPARAGQMGAGDRRRHVFACKKGGAEVGKTKRGKGTKIELLVDNRGLPLSSFITSASHAEVNTIETLLDVRVFDKKPQRLIYDKAADADWLRTSLSQRDVELVCPHRKGRTKTPTQDGRKLRRYRHRWIVERTIAWLQYCRRLVTRQEYYPHLFEGFVHLACLMILVKWF
jgi:transposase